MGQWNKIGAGEVAGKIAKRGSTGWSKGLWEMGQWIKIGAGEVAGAIAKRGSTIQCGEEHIFL